MVRARRPWGMGTTRDSPTIKEETHSVLYGPATSRGDDPSMALVICLDCGREVSSEAPSCPQCGRPWPSRVTPPPSPTQVVPKSPDHNGMSIAALVLGASGVLAIAIPGTRGFLPTVVALTGLIAIPVGFVGLHQLRTQARRQERVQKGRWMAITGIALGTVPIVVTIVVLLAFIYLVWSSSGG